MNFDNKKIMPRFFVVIVLMSLGGLYILGNAGLPDVRGERVLDTGEP